MPWLLTLKTYVVKFVIQYILPKVLEWAQQTIPILASNAMQDIIDKMGKKEQPMSTVTISVMDAQKTPIAGAKISYLVNSITAADKTTDSTGSAAISGLPDGNYTFNISADGYIGTTRTATLSEQAPAIIAVTLVKEVAIAVADAVTNVTSAVAPVVAAAEKVAATSTTDTSYQDVKADYATVSSAFESQKSAVEEAIKSGTDSVAQSEGAKLNLLVTQKLNDSMSWYLKERAKIPCDALGIPNSPARVALWGRYTSMIFGIAFLRKAGMEFINAWESKFIPSIK